MKIKAGTIATAVIAKQNGKSKYLACSETERPVNPKLAEMIAQTGKIKQISIKFAPIILPADKSAFFLIRAVIVVTSSGSDVPIATIVTAITPSDIFII